jgi:PAS domain S-box-containing protein
MDDCIVLFVDDEPSVLNALQRVFRKVSYRLLFARSGQEALELVLRGERPAVVVSDQRMPGMDGVALLEEIRHLHPDGYRVLLTAHGDLDTVSKAVNQGGIHRFLQKPWDRRALRQAVQQGLEWYRLIRENRELTDGLKTKNAQLEEKARVLRDSERRFRELADLLPEIVFETDADTRLTFANRATSELLNRSAGDLLQGVRMADIVTPGLPDPPPGPAGATARWEGTVAGRHGEIIPVQVSCCPIVQQETVCGWRGIAVDVSDRKRAEDERARAEKLEALRDMSAGVSHNLNNLLTGVLVPAEMLRELDESPGVKENAQTIYIAATLAAQLVRRLHLATWGQEDESCPVPVGVAVVDAVRAAQLRWQGWADRPRNAITVDLDVVDVPAVKATATGLTDVLENLMMNAAESMPDGGRISVSVRRSGDEVRVQVQDQGGGMDADTRRRALEPFFTTRMDIGRGLGLATARAALDRWGGGIELDSTPGAGTTATVRLRLSAEPEVGEADPSA